MVDLGEDTSFVCDACLEGQHLQCRRDINMIATIIVEYRPGYSWRGMPATAPKTTTVRYTCACCQGDGRCHFCGGLLHEAASMHDDDNPLVRDETTGRYAHAVCYLHHAGLLDQDKLAGTIESG